jgi:hypothetical protein
MLTRVPVPNLAQLSGTTKASNHLEITRRRFKPFLLPASRRQSAPLPLAGERLASLLSLSLVRGDQEQRAQTGHEAVLTATHGNEAWQALGVGPAFSEL